MTVRDRASMVRRLDEAFRGHPTLLVFRISKFAAREVDRAVRAERKRQRNDEAAFARRRDNAEERFMEAMRELGRHRACSAKL